MSCDLWGYSVEESGLRNSDRGLRFAVEYAVPNLENWRRYVRAKISSLSIAALWIRHAIYYSFVETVFLISFLLFLSSLRYPIDKTI